MSVIENELRLDAKMAALAHIVPEAAHKGALRAGHIIEGGIKQHIRHNPHMLVRPDRRGQSFHEGLIDLGHLLGSVTVDDVPGGANVGPHTDYAAALEFGPTGSSSAGSEDGVEGHVSGRRAFPFVRPGYEEKKKEAVAAVAASIRLGLQKLRFR